MGRLPALKLIVVLVLVLVLGLQPSLPAAEPSGGNYTMRKQAIGAGAESSSPRFRLLGTAAEVGAGESASNRFLLTGGFHPLPEGLGRSVRIFCDGFETGACP